MQTGKGPFTISVNREWAPIGADRFFSLATCNYFDGPTAGNAGFFRYVPQFVVQWGIAGQPAVSAAWENEVRPGLAAGPEER